MIAVDLVEQVVKGLEGGRNPRVVHHAKNNLTARVRRSPRQAFARRTRTPVRFPDRPPGRVAGANRVATIEAMPYFICPNCKRRSIDHDRRDGLTHQAVGCASCGFGFLFELLDDYYPGPATAFVVCDREGRILAAGRGVFELTGYRESELLGRDVMDALGLANGTDGPNPAEVALEWGVRQLGRPLALTTRAGVTKDVRGDFFPAYDEDGGLLVALAPR